MIFEFTKFSEHLAFIDDNNNLYTYGQIGQKAYELYSVIAKRSVVLCLCRNSIGSVLGYLSFIHNMIVPLLISDNTDNDMIRTIIKEYTPAYIWLPKNLKENFKEFEEIYREYDYVLLKTGFSLFEINKDLGAMISTSGSTGSPKLIRLSYKNLYSNALSIASYLEINTSERAITTLPMNYSYGLSVINSHLIKGATILLTDSSLMRQNFWNFFKEYQATSIAGVPFTYQILKKLKLYKMDLPSLKYMTQAGGRLPFELHKEFAEYAQKSGKRFFVMYGQSEATARMSYLPYQECLRKCGSVGFAIPGGKFYLVDDNGQKITSSNTPGELFYEGENVSMGYAQDFTDLKRGDDRKGVLKTGDIAYFDDEGFFYIVGRLSRFLKIFGNRVNLDEVESLLKSKYTSVQLACAGFDDNIYIFVEGNQNMPDIKNFLSKKTALNISAFKVRFIDAIPKNQSGKILYKELEKYYKQ